MRFLGCLTFVSVILLSTVQTLHAQINEAENSALTLVASKIDSLKPDEFVLFDYLDRRFSLNLFDRKTRKKYLMKWFSADSSGTLLYQFRSLVLHSEHRVDLRYATHPIDSVSLLALNCKKELDQDAFIKRLKLHKEKGGYFLTHALLALQWSSELDCVSEPDQQFQELMSDLQEANLEFASNSSAPQDERFESVCMLYYSGFDNQRIAHFRQEVVEMQLDDGGWASSERSQVTDFHTTAFALWILLEQHATEQHSFPKWVVH